MLVLLIGGVILASDIKKEVFPDERFDGKDTEVGSVFVSNYPPFSAWERDRSDLALEALGQGLYRYGLQSDYGDPLAMGGWQQLAGAAGFLLLALAVGEPAPSPTPTATRSGSLRP